MIVRELLAAFALLAIAACTGPQPRATITDVSDTARTNDPTDPANCGSTEILLLTVTDGGKEIAKERYCEYPEETSAKVFKDRRGHIYVFVVTDQYRGTGMHPTELHIRRVNVDRGTLEEVATLQLADLDGGPLPDEESRWDSTYDVLETDSGSLQLVVTYTPGPNASCCAPPEKQMTVRLGSIGADGAAPARATPGAAIRPSPEALLTPASKDWCGKGNKTMVLTVIDGERTLARKDQWCWTAESTVSAQTSTDRRGTIYVLLREHVPSLHTTTGNASDTLRVFELVRNEYRDPPTPYGTEWMADIVLSPPEDPAAQWPTTYHVRDTDGGGLEVNVDYSSVKGVGCCTPPEQQVSIQIGP